MAVLLERDSPFPDPTKLDYGDNDGLVAVGGDLQPERLLSAYRNGIFPWSIDPLTWWSPDPRAIFPWDGFHVSRSLRRRLRQAQLRISFDQAFRAVVEHCARGREEGTWISPEFIDSYSHLHELGHAHSVEAWREGRLVGGLYGVAIGGLFAGESMFHLETDASKIVLYHLHASLKKAGFGLFDIQMLTPVTQQLGAIEVPRGEYLKRVRDAVNLPCHFPSSKTV